MMHDKICHVNFFVSFLQQCALKSAAFGLHSVRIQVGTDALHDGSHPLSQIKLTKQKETDGINWCLDSKKRCLVDQRHSDGSIMCTTLVINTFRRTYFWGLNHSNAVNGCQLSKQYFVCKAASLLARNVLFGVL